MLARVLLLVLAFSLVVGFVSQLDRSGGSLRDRIGIAMAGFGSELGAVTLAQAKLNTTDDIDVQVIDEFRKSSWLLDNLTFDDAVNPAGGGATLTYGYTRLVTQPTAAFRAINAEYTPQEVTKARQTVELKPLGGSFQIDRVLANLGPAVANEVTLQMSQKIKAARTAFVDAVINGDSAVDANSFDGLDAALVGSDTEMNADTTTDWTGITSADDSPFEVLDVLDEFLALLDGPPDVIMGNRAALAKIRGAARRANQYVREPFQINEQASVFVERYGNVVLLDPGTKAGSNADVIPIYDPDNSVWTLHLDAGADGGTFTVEIRVDGGDWEETAAIAFDDTIAEAELAIEANDNVGAGNGTVAGAAKDWVVTFSGALAGKDVDVRIADDSITDGGVAPATPATATESAHTGGVTDLYAVRLGLDGFHGVSVAGAPLVRQWLPDFSTAGAVKTGEVEMGPVAVALKATKAAAVLRRIKVR